MYVMFFVSFLRSSSVVMKCPAPCRRRSSNSRSPGDTSGAAVSLVTTVGSACAIGRSMIMTGAVSAGVIGTTLVSGVKPIFVTRIMLPPSGRNDNVMVPVAVVSAFVFEKTSRTSAPSMGSPVCALKTPSKRARCGARGAGVCAAAPMNAITPNTMPTIQRDVRADRMDRRELSVGIGAWAPCTMAKRR
jgi:hypothetical protein